MAQQAHITHAPTGRKTYVYILPKLRKKTDSFKINGGEKMMCEGKG